MKKKNNLVVIKESKMRKLQTEATGRAAYIALVMFLSVLHDKNDFSVEQLQELSLNITNLSDLVAEGRVSYLDLERMLIEELGVTIGGPNV